MSATNQELRDQLVETANSVAQSGALSLSGHGNISIRIPGRDEMLYTAGPSLPHFPAGGVARPGPVGTLLGGAGPPMAAAGVAMGTLIYPEPTQTGSRPPPLPPFTTASP